MCKWHARIQKFPGGDPEFLFKSSMYFTDGAVTWDFPGEGSRPAVPSLDPYMHDKDVRYSTCGVQAKIAPPLSRSRVK